MADLVRLAYYPFLPGVQDAVREAGVELDDVLRSSLFGRARQRAKERVMGALEDGFPLIGVTDERSALQELLSVAVARMAVAALADRQLTRRYARSEAANLSARLAQEPALLDEIASALEVNFGVDGMRTMSVPDYVSLAPVRDAEWKMLTRSVRAGNVYLSDDDCIALCEEALRKRIESEMEREAKRPLPPQLQEGLEPIVMRLRPMLEDARENWNTGDFGPVQPGLFPPCITDLFGMMERGENIPHHGRFAFASFMGTIGMTAEQVMDYLSATPNFDREKSRYQIEHITGERGVEAYTPPGCQSMQTNGICPLEKRDGLCMKIKHPLSYYRAKLRFQKQDQEKADEALANQTQGTNPANPGAATNPKPAPKIDPRVAADLAEEREEAEKSGGSA